MSFSEEYKKLNTEQRSAVDYIDGPLMVIAGPGTGKTQLLSLRVANILRQTDAGASSILCLTYTNKAATNMQERLLRLIGSEATHVGVRTFHSFAAEIMNRHPEYFWSGARLAIAPDAVQLEIVQEILHKLPVEHPLALKFAGQFTLIKDVQNAINLTKEAGLTPKSLRQIISANIAFIERIEPQLAIIGELRVSSKNLQSITQTILELPEQDHAKGLPEPFKGLDQIIKDSFQTAVTQAAQLGKNTPISLWKRRWIQRVEDGYRLANEQRRNEWWLGVADAYELYRKHLHQRGYYDYADMLVEVIAQIQAHSSLRAELQEQYQYVLIDEFQDTNAAQLQLAHLVADHFTSQGKPNLMVVGDDDQSIFKFQGAELSNMLDFTRRYRESKVIVLTINYRSTQEILDAANTVISHSSYRLVEAIPNLIKQLTAQTKASAGAIRHLRYGNRPEQLTGMGAEIARLYNDGQSVAVLARSHASLRDMAHVLAQQGVAIRYEQSNNIFERDGINQTLIILRLIIAITKGDSDRASELLALSLAHPMWHIEPHILWEFVTGNYANPDWYGSLLTAENVTLQAIGRWIAQLVSLSTSESATIVVEEVLGIRNSTSPDTGPEKGHGKGSDKYIQSPLKQYFLDQKLPQNTVSQSYLETLAALQLLRTLVVEFCSNKQPRIADFVAFVDLMQQNSRILADTTPFQSGERFVELLSVHKAKGLEYDAVAVIDASHDEWSPRAKGRMPPANLPLRPADDDSDDYVRLMYVAATRARRSLLLASYEQSIKGEAILASPIIDGLTVEMIKPQRNTELQTTLETALRWPRLEQTDEKALLRSWLENYTMSVTHLINFLDVTNGGPQHFFERNILRLPSAKSPAAALGTAVHDAMQLGQNLTNQDNFTTDAVYKQFVQSLQLQGLAHSDYKKQLARGNRIIKHLFDANNFTFKKGAKPEYAIKDVVAGDAKLNGKLDSIHINEDATQIIDYKTGRPLLSLNAKAGDEGVRAWKHRNQLVFYALLAQLSPLVPTTNLICQMVYLEAQNSKELSRSYHPSPDEITRLSSLSQVVWKHVKDLDFPDISSYQTDLTGITAFENDLLEGRI